MLVWRNYYGRDILVHICGMRVSVHTCLCVYMWRLEVKIECLPLHSPGRVTLMLSEGPWGRCTLGTTLSSVVP